MLKSPAGAVRLAKWRSRAFFPAAPPAPYLPARRAPPSRARRPRKSALGSARARGELNRSATAFWRQANSTAPCVPKVVVAARIITDRAGLNPAHEHDDRIVIAQRLLRRRRQKRFLLVGLWMRIYNRQVALARTRRNTFEYEFSRARSFQRREIFRGRADEDQVVIFGVVSWDQSSYAFARTSGEDRLLVAFNGAVGTKTLHLAFAEPPLQGAQKSYWARAARRSGMMALI